MPKKINLTLVTLLLLAGFILSFGIGYIAGSEPSPGFENVEQAWDIIIRDYVANNEIDVDLLAEGAIKGMVEVLDDPYTSYLNTDDYTATLGDLAGEFEGIGAEVAMKDGQMTVTAPIVGSPAAEAGIRAGDVILEVDGQPTSEMSLVEAVFNVRGPEGTLVRLLVIHPDETDPVEIEVIRGAIELASVSLQMVDDIAHIHISQFGEKTDEELESVLATVTAEAATGIILDVRHNPGGLLDTVVNIVSRFLEKGVILIIRDNEGNEKIIEVNHQELTTGLPMVVLVDAASASGSEVLAGALQDHTRAIIAGSTTFGKGSVNILDELGNGFGLYITTARWLTPDGHLIEGEGITPDYPLELSGDDAVQWAIDYLHNNQ
ncbi:MAG: S41 family peptidase [Dehalococcoidales bacterium]|nr:S41 family peptidase [Dehalococcoidales bacterium]